MLATPVNVSIVPGDALLFAAIEPGWYEVGLGFLCVTLFEWISPSFKRGVIFLLGCGASKDFPARRPFSIMALSWLINGETLPVTELDLWMTNFATFLLVMVPVPLTLMLALMWSPLALALVPTLLLWALPPPLPIVFMPSLSASTTACNAMDAAESLLLCLFILCLTGETLISGDGGEGFVITCDCD